MTAEYTDEEDEKNPVLQKGDETDNVYTYAIIFYNPGDFPM